MSPATGERLNRFLARRGVASRRAADQLIAAGRVHVNRAPARLGLVIDPERDTVSVDGRGVTRSVEQPVTLVLNKPAGVVTTRADPQRRRTVMDLVEPVPGLVPVGRLDADSRGLLLLTTDGDLAHRLTHPRFGVRKRYRLTVAPPAGDDQLEQLTQGVLLEDGPARALEVRRASRPGAIEVVMAEGRRREVRRLCSAVGLEVTDLQRRAIGPVQLGRLAEGSARRLTAPEERALRKAVGLL